MVVDSSALMAILRKEPEAERFAALIADSDGCTASALSLLEASMVLAGNKGTDADFTRLDVLIAELDIEVVALDARQAMVARDAFLRYGKGRHKAALNMGDCASYALARSRSLPLLFKGNDFTQTDLPAAA